MANPQTAVHPPCGKSWTGYRAEHCPACCQTFSGSTAGDLHRAGPYEARYCRPPAEVGLHEDDRGIWRLPPGSSPWVD